MTRKLIAILSLTFFVGLVAVLFLKSADNGTAEFAETEENVRAVNQYNSDLDSAVLTMRLGLVDDYDELTRCELALQQLLLERLQRSDWAAEVPAQQIRLLVEKKSTLVADFKAGHAIVRNAVAGFRHHCGKTFSEIANASSSDVAEIARLETIGSRFVVSGSVDDQSSFEAAVQRIEVELLPKSEELRASKSLALTLKHARNLVERRIQLDDTIEALVSVPIRQQTIEIIEAASARQQAMSQTAGWFRACLSIAVVALIGFCVFQYIALYKQSSALADANHNLEERVARRTAALASANERLEVTIAEAEKLALVARYTDNAVTITNQNAVIEWVNDGFTRITGYEPEEAIGQRPADFLFGPETTADKIEIMKKAIEAKEGFDIETVYYRKNGEPYFVEIEVRPIKDQHGEVCRFIAIESDITDRVNGVIERQRLNEQLVDASRMAGMAEVATGVLHNVGNILNSVNVSTNVIQQQFQRSALGNLDKITSLIAEHENDFGDFIRNDSRGQRLPGFITKLAESLKLERESVNNEFKHLINNVDHIKEIVSAQQSMAKSSGCMQELSPEKLIQDSIVANKGTLTNHQVKITTEIADHLPTLVSDKHKILQVLINLIKNAKDAMVEQGTANPEIVVRVEAVAEYIVFKVIDNGIGIPADLIDKIFNHGFTTKKTGHGFGLHSSANAATELGGSLTVSSEGVGTGATFELKLPAAEQPATLA